MAANGQNDQYIPAGAGDVEPPYEAAPYADVPPRMRGLPASIVNDVNDWHMPMLNDLQRNEAYQEALEKLVGPNDIVVEIGTGSGILSMMAARAGAEKVYAIEASKNFGNLARTNFRVNNLMDKIELVQGMSTEVVVRPQTKKRKLNENNQPPEPPSIPRRATLLVAEILGTMLDGESCIYYYQDARERLLAPNCKILPAYGVQYASIISSEQFKKITQAYDFDGLDLSGFNLFRDSCSLVFSKNYGVLLNSLDLVELTEPMVLFECDFTSQGREVFRDSMFFEREVINSGEAVAIMYWWEIYLDEERTIKISTHPNETRGNIPRDLNWGQGVQLVEGPNGWNSPKPVIESFEVGDTLRIHFSGECSGKCYHGRVLNEEQFILKQEEEQKRATESHNNITEERYERYYGNEHEDDNYDDDYNDGRNLCIPATLETGVYASEEQEAAL